MLFDRDESKDDSPLVFPCTTPITVEDLRGASIHIEKLEVKGPTTRWDDPIDLDIVEKELEEDRKSTKKKKRDGRQ